MIQITDRHTCETVLELPDETLIGKDLRRFYLSHANLGGFDLRNCILAEMNLDETEFSGADLRGADFHGSSLIEAVLTNTKLHNACLTRVVLNMTTFANAKLYRTDFSEARITGVANFKNASAVRAKFRNIPDFGKSIFWNTNCFQADFKGSDLSKIDPIDIVGCNLHGTLFEHLMRGKYMSTPASEDEKILCSIHENEERFQAPALIYCIICSQVNDPDTRRESYYTAARLCGNCAANTQICAICEEPF